MWTQHVQISIHMCTNRCTHAHGRTLQQKVLASVSAVWCSMFICDLILELGLNCEPL